MSVSDGPCILGVRRGEAFLVIARGSRTFCEEMAVYFGLFGRTAQQVANGAETARIVADREGGAR